MNTQTQKNNLNKNRWTTYNRVNDFSPLIQSTVEDDSDLQQRSRCEEYRARAEFTSFMTHDAMELARNSNRRHWDGCETIRSDGHVVR